MQAQWLGADATSPSLLTQNGAGNEPRPKQNSAQRIGGSELAGRIYAGYRLNPMFAVKSGYSNFGTLTLPIASTRTGNFFPPIRQML